MQPYILIVCEGAKTEPIYLDKMKKHYRLPAAKIEIVPGNISGTNPKSVVEYAKRRMEELVRENNDIENENVWCVFDRDQHEKLHEALQQAEDNGFGVGFSNPSFELWLLLHFQDQQAEIERKVVTSRLKKHIKDYEKNSRGTFDRTIDRLAEAKTRAEYLRKMHIRNKNPENHNPSTSVDKLVNHLEKYRTDID